MVRIIRARRHAPGDHQEIQETVASGFFTPKMKAYPAGQDLEVVASVPAMFAQRVTFEILKRRKVIRTIG